MAIRSFSTCSAILAATTIGLTLSATPVAAQDYRDAAYENSMERVIITAPRPPQDRSAIGAPIVDVAISREIRIDDLDLRTGWGVRVLERRVSDAARDLCQRLDLRYPIATSDSPPCYEAAYEDAMAQADAAIARARDED
jgi:UrcA family protein